MSDESHVDALKAKIKHDQEVADARNQPPGPRTRLRFLTGLSIQPDGAAHVALRIFWSDGTESVMERVKSNPGATLTRGEAYQEMLSIIHEAIRSEAN